MQVGVRAYFAEGLRAGAQVFDVSGKTLQRRLDAGEALLCIFALPSFSERIVNALSAVVGMAKRCMSKQCKP